MLQQWCSLITIIVLLNVAGFLLQGCGGGGSTPTPAPTPKPTPAPGPAPPSPRPLDLLPLRGVSYNALPCNKNDAAVGGTCHNVGVPKPGQDYAQEGYRAMWGKEGRDDLGTLARLGANFVRVDSALGLESKHDHGAFLDRAQELGLHVMLGFHTQMICPKFNCFDAWKTAAKVGLANGLKAKVGGGWHPAVTMLILQDSPDILNFGNVTLASCTDADKSPNAVAKCRVRAVLSAMDGLLMAEKESGVKSTVNITAAWSSQVQDSIDGKVKKGIGIYGFQDMVAGVARPGLAGYKFMSSERDVKAAFEGRWTHSINAEAGWDFVKEKVGDLYEQYQFPPKKWFLAEYKGVGLSPTQLTQDLQSMDEEGEKGKHFLGANVYQFQSDYTNPTPQLFGLFGLGNASTGQTTDVCQEDETTHVAHCAKWPAYCLQALDSERSRAPCVASGWNGSTATLHGQCAKLLSKANINNTNNSTDLDSRPALSGQSGVRVVV